MDFSLSDNNQEGKNEGIFILNFSFNKTFSGTHVGHIGRVPDPFGVQFVGVLMSPHESSCVLSV